MRLTSTGVSLVRSGRSLTAAMLTFLLVSGVASAQETELDPNRVFTTELHWDRVAGSPHSERLRYADGTLVILYLDGTYAEVRASFIKTGGKVPVGLNLNEGFIVRLGTWSRTEDDVLIRTVSREVLRDKIVSEMKCQTAVSGRVCAPVTETPLPGPVLTNTCRLEHPSTTHIADAIVCRGLTVFHPQHVMDLSDFPSIVRGLVKKQKSEPNGSSRVAISYFWQVGQ
jgi:hypothetical protein